MLTAYNSTFGGGNIRTILSTIIRCLPTPVSIPTVGNISRGSGRIRHRTSSGRPFTTLTFGVTASPFMNALAFVHMCSNIIGANSNICGSMGRGHRHFNHVIRLRTGGHRRMGRVHTNSVTTTVNLGSMAANSALYSRGTGIVLRHVRFPRPIVRVTIRPEALTSRRGVNITLNGLTTRSPSFHMRASERSKRALVSNVNRLRLSVVISHVGHRFDIRYGINGPRMTCHRAVHNGTRIRNGFVHRSNNHNRCNRI